jgi:hypothetical protein
MTLRTASPCGFTMTKGVFGTVAGSNDKKHAFVTVKEERRRPKADRRESEGRTKVKNQKIKNGTHVLYKN